MFGIGPSSNFSGNTGIAAPWGPTSNKENYLQNGPQFSGGGFLNPNDPRFQPDPNYKPPQRGYGGFQNRMPRMQQGGIGPSPQFAPPTTFPRFDEQQMQQMPMQPMQQQMGNIGPSPELFQMLMQMNQPRMLY